MHFTKVSMSRATSKVKKQTMLLIRQANSLIDILKKQFSHEKCMHCECFFFETTIVTLEQLFADGTEPARYSHNCIKTFSQLFLTYNLHNFTTYTHNCF